MGVEGDPATLKGGVTEAEAIVAQAQKSIGEPGQSVESAAKEVIMEDSETKPGPALSLEAAKAAQKNKV
jgi:protein phosphatase PTC1